MIYTYRYRLQPTTEQKLLLNQWLRICMYWYNRQLGERFQWWSQNRSAVNSCRLVCYLSELKDRPQFYEQKKQLPILKRAPVVVGWSGEQLDFTSVPSQTLQSVSKRVKLAFDRFVRGDSNGKRSGRPRFRNTARYRSMIFEQPKLHSCSVGGKWLDLTLPKIGIVKVRHHRPLPCGASFKQAQVIKTNSGWYINLRLEDKTVPDLENNIVPTWDNSLGMDAVLHEDDYLATSEGVKLKSVKSFRRNQKKLAKVSAKRAGAKARSKARRKLAKKEGRVHGKIARARRDHAFKTAHALLRTGKTVFFYEKLNLKGLMKRAGAKQADDGTYLPNGQSAKSGLAKSWGDAAFGEFFSVLEYIAGKAGAKALSVNPAYTSQLLAYKDELVFTNVSIREYWDKKYNLLVDRDVNAGINIKRRGLDLFPTFQRRQGKPCVVKSTTEATSKEVLSILRDLGKPTSVPPERSV